jgi:type II secretory pathway pseudopilin PulG
MVKSLTIHAFVDFDGSARPLQWRLQDKDIVVIRKAQGFALIDLIFVCGIIGVLCSIAIPRFLLAKQTAGAASAVGSLRVINSSELTYALTCGGGFYAPNLTTLGVLPPGSREPFIPVGMSEANTITKSGYVLQLDAVPFPGSPGSCNGVAGGAAGQGYRAGADAVDMDNRRFFATNSNAVIYEDTAPLFATMPETGGPATGHMIR